MFSTSFSNKKIKQSTPDCFLGAEYNVTLSILFRSQKNIFQAQMILENFFHYKLIRRTKLLICADSLRSMALLDEQGFSIFISFIFMKFDKVETISCKTEETEKWWRI